MRNMLGKQIFNTLLANCNRNSSSALTYQVNIRLLFYARNAEVLPFSAATLSRSCLACSLATRELPTRYSFTFCKIKNVIRWLLLLIEVVSKYTRVYREVEVFYFLQVGPASGHAGLGCEDFSVALLTRLAAELQIVIAYILQQGRLSGQHALSSLNDNDQHVRPISGLTNVALDAFGAIKPDSVILLVCVTVLHEGCAGLGYGTLWVDAVDSRE